MTDPIRDSIRAERLAVVSRLRGLPEPDWATPSLCAGWTVRHVLAHLVTPFEVSVPRFGLAVLRHRGLDGAMTGLAATLARRPADELLDVLEARAGSGFHPPGMPMAAPLTDAVVHSADIRWALGDDHADPADPVRLRPALDFLVSPAARRGLVPRGRLDGLRLVATDQDWAHGTGAEVGGGSLHLMMGMLGRAAAYPHLDGPGVRTLADRAG